MDAQLCQACRALNLEAQIFNPEPRAAATSLGLMDQIRRRSDECALCRLISNVGPARGKDNHECFLTYVPKLRDWAIVNPAALGDNSVYFNEVQLAFKHPDGNYKSFVTLLPCPPQIPTCDEATCQVPGREAKTQIPWLSPRRVEAALPLKLLKHWISACDEFHGKDCESPPWATDVGWPARLRLVDVKRNCLVEAAERTRYAALSYVWGEQSMLMHGLARVFRVSSRPVRACKAQVRSMEVEGALARLDLPKTIREAMALARDLGETHLWVDALCVVQDDPSDLAIQIPQMDVIYANAAFTIVAASGDSAEAGLARHNRHVKSGRITSHPLSESLTLVSRRYEDFHDSVFGMSPWMRRGWTFQEYLLSRRKIFLMKDRVCWQCESDLWDEGTAQEPWRGCPVVKTSPNFAGHFVTISILSFDKSLSVNPTTVSEAESESAKSSVQAILAAYSARKFNRAHEYDISNALQGVFRRLSAMSGEMFHWGLAQSDFEYSLHWRPLRVENTRSRLRRCILPMQNQQGDTWQTKIPSWSWMAWRCILATHRGPEDAMFGPPTSTGKRDAALEWYKVDVAGHLLPLDRPEHSRVPTTALPRPRWRSAITHTPVGNAISAADFKDSGRLRVVTSCATLTLRQVVGVEISGVFSQDAVYPYTILDSDAKPTGSMFDFTYTDPPRSKSKPEQRCDFVVIAESARSLRDLRDRDLVPQLGTDDTWYLLYAMLVEWDEKREVAYRQGIFGISEADWMRANPELRVVTLG